MRRLVFGGVVLVVLVVLAGSAPGGDGARVVANGLIVFGGSNPSGLFVVDPVTRATRRVTTGNDVDPAWSPDGRRIAFVRTTASPSGQTSAVFIVNADGGGLRRVTETAQSVGSPDWSPNGKRIAFTRFDGNTERGVYTRGIYIVNADGSGLRHVATRIPFVMDVSWSSTGLLAHDTEGWIPDIWTVRPDGSLPRRLTWNYRSLWPAWSPSGRRIAYVHGGADTTREVYVMDANGKNPVRLTNNEVDDREPAWSPDGQRIAYIHEVRKPLGGASRWFLQMMNGDGSQPQRLVGASMISSPDWQPIPR